MEILEILPGIKKRKSPKETLWFGEYMGIPNQLIGRVHEEEKGWWNYEMPFWGDSKLRGDAHTSREFMESCVEDHFRLVEGDSKKRKKAIEP